MKISWNKNNREIKVVGKSQLKIIYIKFHILDSFTNIYLLISLDPLSQPVFPPVLYLSLFAWCTDVHSIAMISNSSIFRNLPQPCCKGKDSRQALRQPVRCLCVPVMEDVRKLSVNTISETTFHVIQSFAINVSTVLNLTPRATCLTLLCWICL